MTDPLPLTMRAALCTGPGAPLRLMDIPVPQPGPGQILVRLEACGVCHSDLHLRDGDEDLPDTLYPLVLGHEGIGRVVATCAGGPKIGSRVGLPWLYETCLDCKPCRSGAETFCQSQTARGVQHHGAFAEYALAEAAFAAPIPDIMDPALAAPLLCAGLTAWAALGKTRAGPGLRVLIIGAGGLGQYAILIARARGAEVIVIDTDPAKLDTARALGADHAILAGPKAGAGVQALGGADVTLNFAPSAAVWPTIETAAAPMSEIVAVALIHDPVPLSLMWLLDGGHKVYGSSVGTRQEMADFLSFAATHPLPVTVERMAFSDVDLALDRLKSGDVSGRLCIDFSL